MKVVAKTFTEMDGVEVRHCLELEATMWVRPVRILLSAEEFNAMNWPMKYLGPKAIVYPHQKEHARTAIQVISKNVESRTIYTHTGWTKVSGEWVYLHAAGAIGADGSHPEIEVRLPAQLQHLKLPEPSVSGDIVRAVKASLKLLDLGPDEVTFPVLCAVYRAPIGSNDFVVHLAGSTGLFKSELASSAQQHYGAGFDSRHLPASWSSTGNALEALAFIAKDTLMVVDDFAPSGTSNDRQRFHREADRFIRGVGNSAGRQRMKSDTNLSATKTPRCLPLSTGEDIFDGQSIRARSLIVEISKGYIDPAKLTECQADGGGCSTRLQWLAT